VCVGGVWRVEWCVVCGVVCDVCVVCAVEKEKEAGLAKARGKDSKIKKLQVRLRACVPLVRA